MERTPTCCPRGVIGPQADINGIVLRLGSVTDHADPGAEVTGSPDSHFLKERQIDREAEQDQVLQAIPCGTALPFAEQCQRRGDAPTGTHALTSSTEDPSSVTVAVMS